MEEREEGEESVLWKVKECGPLGSRAPGTVDRCHRGGPPSLVQRGAMKGAKRAVDTHVTCRLPSFRRYPAITEVADAQLGVVLGDESPSFSPSLGERTHARHA